MEFVSLHFDYAHFVFNLSSSIILINRHYIHDNITVRTHDYPSNLSYTTSTILKRMEEALQIQIFAIVMLFMVSLIGMSMPLMLLTENDRKIFPYINSLAAGIMIGLSMVSIFVSGHINQLYSDCIVL